MRGAHFYPHLIDMTKTKTSDFAFIFLEERLVKNKPIRYGNIYHELNLRLEWQMQDSKCLCHTS